VVHVDVRVVPPPFGAEVVRIAADAALRHERAVGDMTVVLGDDAELRELNRRYMDVDAYTDVLSFPSNEIDPESGERYLGDVLISVPLAAMQAQAAGHAIESEVQLLVVHGVLHLLGYDHADAEAKAGMWAAQARVLDSLGLSHIVIRD
jgi:probable rRNA maturation factor